MAFKHDDDGIPVMTDSMKKALDQGKDVPLEQLVTDQGMAQIEQQEKARRAPIRAGDLRPISRAEARRRTTFSGETMPDLPSTRRVLPEPFQRPSITVSARGGHGKKWQLVQASQVAVGDVVPGVGLVTAVNSVLQYEDAPEGMVLSCNCDGSSDVAIPHKSWCMQITGQIPVAECIEVYGGVAGIPTRYDPLDQVRVFRKAEPE